MVDPLDCPKPGRRSFVVTVYNQKVRELLKENAEHLLIHERWADVTESIVQARDEAEAKARAAQHFRPEEGFVIDSVRLQ